jgi:hypothetical protein
MSTAYKNPYIIAIIMYISISMILILVTKVLLSFPTCHYDPRKGTSRLEVKMERNDLVTLSSTPI